MARFDRHDAAAGELPVALDSAADELKRIVEIQIRELVESAEEHAATIERDAEERARQTERDAEERARQIERESAERARRIEHEAEDHAALLRRETAEQSSRLIEGIDFLEAGIEVLRELREEVERPIAAPAQGGDGVEAEGEAVEGEEEAEADDEQGAAEDDDSPPNGEEQGDDPHPADANGVVGTVKNGESELSGMIRGQILRMREQGTSREEVERLLTRFKLGESYTMMLDQIYPRDEESEPTKRRRFGLGRRDA